LSAVLSRWNLLPPAEAAGEILPCCGSRRWAREMSSARPLSDLAAMLLASDANWRGLSAADWDEAFQNHPRIGGSDSAEKSGAQFAKWSAEEQARAAETVGPLQQALADGNREYERKFGRIFIICASGKSTAEILVQLRRRLDNEDAAELLEAAEQQRQITQIRLTKWLTG
jgi:2-oxo-4-hydroxy-4-carboxy-5-ureidoimidazoline decarboxylase